MYIDTHCHLHHERFNSDRNVLIEQMKEKNITYFLECPIGFESNYTMREKIKPSFPAARFAVGIHPTRTAKYNFDSKIKRHLEEFATLPNTIAVGETGLDYHIPEMEDLRPHQKQWFRYFIDLSLQKNLPLVLHIRETEAYEDAFRILCEYGPDDIRGVIHCFDGSVDTAEKYMNAFPNIYFGIGGKLDPLNPVLYEAAKKIPLSKIVLETDSPFLAPPEVPGKNSPLNITLIAEKLAFAKEMPIQDIEKITSQNALNLFKFN